MPDPFSHAPADGASRDSRDPARRLGPYETAYEVRRGYDETGPVPPPSPAERREPAWMGRRRER
ncbi:MAG TPA: hypothetical protein VHG51_00665 [Longimicrobiaceae bacterium]|nr:hypothetical protein [Longimicrobiaceae bacterium]